MSDSISQLRLDELWDYADPAGSESRFRAATADVAPASTVAAELTTQLARALGLQDRFTEADAVLDSIENPDGVVAARVLLERGRLRNSAGDATEAVPLLEAAMLIAAAEGNDFLTVDAAHMLGIADPERIVHWTARALETVDESSDPRTKRWAVSLHNNLGSSLFERGELEAALAEFELSADAARDYGTPQQQQWAQESIDEVLAALRR